MGTNERFSGAAASCAALGIEHGYAIYGDVVELQAQILLPGGQPGALALQLWALTEAHAGGQPQGVLVAELPLAVQAHDGVLAVAGTVPAQLPAGTADYAMALVLAEAGRGVLDYCNYARRQAFSLPHFAAALRCERAGDALRMACDAITNPRAADTLSGSLRVELWALEQTYQGGAFAGQALGGADIGVIGGGQSLAGVELMLPVQLPAAGNQQLVAMLREWTDLGYVTRDYVNLPALPAEVENAAPSVLAEAVAPVQAAAPAAPAAPAVPSAPAVAAQVCAEVVSERAADEPAPASGVSVNRASSAQLAGIKGLSKPLAAAIVAGRPYASLDDLLGVKGMGPKLLAKLREQLAL